MSLRSGKIVAQEPSRGKRLDEKAWIIAALRQMATHGIDGVRVELLARQLGVTKGSFYWHFKDRDDLHGAMLEYWRSRSTLALIERMDQSGEAAKARLDRLIETVIKPNSHWGDNIELALRLWSRRDARARATLAEVDQLRVRYIASLLVEAGQSEQDAQARALIIYAFMRVGPGLAETADGAAMARARNLLVE